LTILTVTVLPGATDWVATAGVRDKSMMYCAAAVLGSAAMMAVMMNGDSRLTAGVMRSPYALSKKRRGKH
jgi:hypothetical protein